MKAIETIYNGYRFRSRLEAKWAIFFDELKIRYQYELEGYELPNGMRYLPDFYIESMNLFVEIKPSVDSISNEGIDKMISFSVEGRKNLLLITGQPTKDYMFLLSHETTHTIDDIPILYDVPMLDGNVDINSIYKCWKDSVMEEAAIRIERDAITWKWVFVLGGKMKEWFVDSEIKSAKNKAIRSRFEFSEKKK